MKLLLLEKSEETCKWINDWYLLNVHTFLTGSFLTASLSRLAGSIHQKSLELAFVCRCLSSRLIGSPLRNLSMYLKQSSNIKWPKSSTEQIFGIKLHRKWIFMIKLLTCWVHLSREKYTYLCSVDASPPDTSFWSVSVKDRVCFMSE